MDLGLMLLLLVIMIHYECYEMLCQAADRDGLEH
jgi:hypothetical protein